MCLHRMDLRKWWGVIWILFAVGVVEIVPATSNRVFSFAVLVRLDINPNASV